MYFSLYRVIKVIKNRIILMMWPFFMLAIAQVVAMNPPVWPERFSQSMVVNFANITTTGKFWYDSVL